MTPLHGDIPSYVQTWLDFCIRERVSDLHLEPVHDHYRLRVRRDGQLRHMGELTFSMAQGVLHHLKVLSNRNVAENRRPQDGSLIGKDIRLSLCPTVAGEKCVLRFLQTGVSVLDLKTLGFLPEQLMQVGETLKRSQGLILVSGPTGSGKSLSLYSMLTYLNTPERHLMTIEDPVEMRLPGVTQTQIHPEIGLGFSELLRSTLRQDPNVLMIGEIRDEPTAQLAIKAAQTGHLVLATVHANSAAESLLRLETLGIDRFSLACSAVLLMAQRLVRKPNGGRVALFELIVPTELDREQYVLHRTLPRPEISLKDHALRLAEDGQLSKAQVAYVWA